VPYAICADPVGGSEDSQEVASNSVRPPVNNPQRSSTGHAAVLVPVPAASACAQPDLQWAGAAQPTHRPPSAPGRPGRQPV